jgi:predicted MPP superfamily phosphohydrolase
VKNRFLAFALFFSIVLTVYGLLNYYVVSRGWYILPEEYRLLYALVFIFLAASYPVGRFLERVTLSWLSSSLVWIGSYWLAAFVYIFLALLTIDLLRLINLIVPYLPSFLTNDVEQTNRVLATTLVIAVVVALVTGHINARRPRIKVLNLTIPKNSHALTSLNIVAASDIHLGTVICQSRLEQIVQKINALNPDIVVLPGDVVDEDLGPVIKQNLGEILRSIQAKHGVFAITGNHEYIGGVEEACQYLTDHGIQVLRDQTVKLLDSVYILGREDRSIAQFSRKKRMPLAELMKEVDRSFPIILLDHQPFQLHEAEQQGVDLQLSGHTHHGQLWPFSFITKKVYELSWGYKKKGNTHVYVSSGVGTWGPPIRLGNRPEIVNVRLSFE